MAVLRETRELLEEWLEDLFGEGASPAQAAGCLANPAESLAEHGLSLDTLNSLDLDTFQEAVDSADISDEAREGLASFRPTTGGSSQSTELVTHVSTVATTVYEGDQHFVTLTRSFTTFDNSTDVDIDGDVDGDVDLDIDQEQEVEDSFNEANAEDGGVAVVGEDNETNAATGEQSQVIDGDNEGIANTGDDNTIAQDGQANSGDGAVLVGDDLEDSLVNTGEVEEGAVLANGDINAPVNTGENDGIIADGDAEDNVVGDDNTVANVDGDNEGVIGFGDGDITNINDSDLDDTAVATGGDATNVSDNEDSAVSFGGDAQNISNNEVEDGAIAGDDASNLSNSDVDVDDGSALSVGGDAEADNEDSFNEDNDDFDNSFNETDVDAEESIVGTAQGEDAEVDQEEAELDD